MTDQQKIAAIRKRYDKRQEPTFGTCSACGHRQEAPTFGPMAGGMAAEAGRCRKCHNGVMQFTFTINTATYPTPDQDMAELFALLIAQAAHLKELEQENAELLARVAPLNDCVGGQDQPQSGNGAQSPSAERAEQIARSFADKEYSEAFVEAEIATTIPFQIRAMRQELGWTQADLAAKTGQQQATISDFENPNIGPKSIASLRKIAAAFDVALIVRFAPFSELVEWVANLSQKDHAVPSRTMDGRLHLLSSQAQETGVLKSRREKRRSAPAQTVEAQIVEERES